DRDAIGLLLEKLAPRLRAAVLAAGIPARDADDAVQEAMARALARWADPKDERALEQWLATIARNLAVDWRRRHDRARERFADRDPALEPAPRDAEAPATSALRGVPADAIAILELRYGDGLSGRELAARLGVSLEAAKKRLQRARAEALARLRGRRP